MLQRNQQFFDEMRLTTNERAGSFEKNPFDRAHSSNSQTIFSCKSNADLSSYPGSVSDQSIFSPNSPKEFESISLLQAMHRDWSGAKAIPESFSKISREGFDFVVGDIDSAMHTKQHDKKKSILSAANASEVPAIIFVFSSRITDALSTSGRFTSRRENESAPAASIRWPHVRSSSPPGSDLVNLTDALSAVRPLHSLRRHLLFFLPTQSTHVW
jgi:hypothetical protein